MRSIAEQIADCPTPVYHATHNYCPSCPWTIEVENPPSAVVKAVRVLRDAVPGATEFGCPCGGAWLYEGDVCAAAAHAEGCTFQDVAPPRRGAA